MARVKDIWDFDDPAGSEARFRKAAANASGPEREALLTQAARALGLRGEYDDAHALLDSLTQASPEVAVRVALERGRLLRSAGDPDAARPHFAAAAETARGAGLEELHLDALHMIAIVAPLPDQPVLQLAALEIARAATDPEARAWEAPLLNNLGMTYADLEEWPRAVAVLEEAVAVRRRLGDPDRLRLAEENAAWARDQAGVR